MRLFKLLVLTLLCFTISNGLDAQGQGQVVLKGNVSSSESGEQLVGATVIELGTSNGVSTLADGSYTIRVRPGSTVQFSYMGYKTLEYIVPATAAGSTEIVYNAQLLSEATSMDDIVVIAYGVRKRSEIAGSVSTVDASILHDAPVASFDQALQGRATGVSVLSSSGEPGATAKIQIRGTNSITAGTDPLIIVDGIPVGADYFNALNPNDIENTTILKDAASTAIYGARAANGVIVITTKRGKQSERPSINYSMKAGFSNLAYGKWDLMNTEERIQYEQELGLNPGANYELLRKTDVNWLKEVFKNNAFLQGHDVSIGGGNQAYNYYVSGSYYGQEGIAPQSDFNRYSMRANFDLKAAKWLNIGFSNTMAYEYYEEATAGDGYYVNTPITGARFMLPYWNPYNADGSIASINDGTWTGMNQNPLEWVLYSPSRAKKYKLLSSMYVEVKPIDNLVIRSTGGIDYTGLNYKYASSPDYRPTNGVGSVQKGSQTGFNLTLINTANYTLRLDEGHNFIFLLGQEMIDNRAESLSVISRGQTNSRLLTLSTGTEAPSWSDSYGSSSYLSVFSRVDYDYKGKYYGTATFRTDASSRFGSNNRWAQFWSLGGMWNILQEDFMPKVGWLNMLQLSASYGTSGNSSISNYIHQAYVGGGPSYNDIAGIAPTTRGNKDLTWEQTASLNVGVRAMFLGRLNFSAEFYNRKTTDMLLGVPVSLTTGWSTEIHNIGSMVNRGVEAEVSGAIIRAKGFQWGVNANVSYNHNEMLSLFGDFDEYELGSSGTMLKVGRANGEFYLNRYAGVNPINGEQLWYDKDGNITNEYNAEDKVFVGKSYNAPWTGGFGTDLSYKGFRLDVFFSWVKNRWMLNNDRWMDEGNGTFDSTNQSRRLLNRWKKPGDITDIPRHGEPQQMDTRFLEDASFLRLKNVTLSYNLPKTLLQKTKFIEGVRVYAQATNLITWTKFTGLDPESYLNVYKAAYPMSRQYTFGLEISF